MKQIEKDLEKIKNIKLRGDEKALIRANLIDKINERSPLSPYKFDFSPYVLVSNWNRFSLMKVGAFAVLFMFVFGSSLTYASEKSLPGEALYSIKVNVKEELEIKLASTPEKKASVEKAHIEKRLEEISTLKESGNLTEENSAIAIEEFKERTGDLHESIDDLQEEGKSEAILEITQDLIPVLTDFVEESTPEDVSVKTNSEITVDIDPGQEKDKEEIEPKVSEKEATPQVDVAISSFVSIATEEVEKIIAKESEVLDEVKEDAETMEEEIEETGEIFEEVEIGTETDTDEVSAPETATTPAATSTLIMATTTSATMGDFGTLSGKVFDSCMSINQKCDGKEVKSGTILIYTNDKKVLVKAVDVDIFGQFKTKLSPGSYLIDIRRVGTEKVIGVPEVINIKKSEEVSLEISVYGKEPILSLPLGL